MKISPILAKPFVRALWLPAHILAAMMLLPVAAFAVDGVDLPGSDYDNFDAASVSVCRNSCGADGRCQAYTWVKPGVQALSGRCWLKDRVPRIVKNPCCNSGARNQMSRGDVKAEDNTDRPGLDFRNFVTNSWQTCETECTNNGSCAAWAYARPGVQGPQGHCWLKSAVPHPFANPNTVSGVKFKYGQTIDAGANLIPVDE